MSIRLVLIKLFGGFSLEGLQQKTCILILFMANIVFQPISGWASDTVGAKMDQEAVRKLKSAIEIYKNYEEIISSYKDEINDLSSTDTVIIKKIHPASDSILLIKANNRKIISASIVNRLELNSSAIFNPDAGYEIRRGEDDISILKSRDNTLYLSMNTVSHCPRIFFYRDKSGRTVAFEWDANGRLISTTVSMKNDVKYSIPDYKNVEILNEISKKISRAALPDDKNKNVIRRNISKVILIINELETLIKNKSLEIKPASGSNRYLIHYVSKSEKSVFDFDLTSRTLNSITHIRKKIFSDSAGLTENVNGEYMISFYSNPWTIKTINIEDERSIIKLYPDGCLRLFARKDKNSINLFFETEWDSSGKVSRVEWKDYSLH